MYPQLQDIPEQLNAQQQLACLTIEQIKKDFLTNGLEVQLQTSEEPNYNEICTALVDVLNWLFENDSHKLMQLLYRIDLPEAKLNEALGNAMEQAVSETLAALIVRREAQKVIIRQFYSQGTKNSA
jgi:hypothetical protein